MVVKTSVLVFLVVTLFRLVSRNNYFGGTYHLHLWGSRWRKYVPLKKCYLPRSPHGITTHKTNTDSVVVCKIIWYHNLEHHNQLSYCCEATGCAPAQYHAISYCYIEKMEDLPPWHLLHIYIHT
jgi:hypothetical protein